MKLLIDACLSPRLITRIDGSFAACAHVFDCGGISDDDLLIWSYAKSNGFTIMTKDSDFMHMSDVFHAPPKVVWLRVGNAGTSEIADPVCKKTDEFSKFEADPDAALLIIDI